MTDINSNSLIMGITFLTWICPCSLFWDRVWDSENWVPKSKHPASPIMNPTQGLAVALIRKFWPWLYGVWQIGNPENPLLVYDFTTSLVVVLSSGERFQDGTSLLCFAKFACPVTPWCPGKTLPRRSSHAKYPRCTLGSVWPENGLSALPLNRPCQLILKTTTHPMMINSTAHQHRAGACAGECAATRGQNNTPVTVRRAVGMYGTWSEVGPLNVEEPPKHLAGQPRLESRDLVKAVT